MNENNLTPPPVPPPLNLPAAEMHKGQPAEEPGDQVPIDGFVTAFESILRQPRRVLWQLRQAGSGKLVGILLGLALISSLIYGLVVGTFSMGAQLWAAPAKVALGLLLSAFICLPSLYIFSALSGSQARLVEVFGLLTGLLALSTVLLIGFAPVAWVFSASTTSVCVMGALHLVFWGIATCFGLRFLQQGFKQLGARTSSGLKVWMAVFLLVALQMTTALRPIIGTGDDLLPVLREKKFFLNYWAECLRKPSAVERTAEQ